MVVESDTALLRSSVPVSESVTPAIPASVPFCRPSLFASLKTRPLITDGASSPKLFAVPLVPSAMMILDNTSFPVVPPCVPMASVPSR